MPPRAVGRPPQFDRATAVLEAARLFWRLGYSGTSTRALSAALGLSTSSIYAAFGSKAELFEEAVRTYAERYRTIYKDACSRTTFAEAMDVLFRRSVEEFTASDANHPGCLASSAAVSDTPDTMNTRTYLDDLHASNHARVQARVQRAQAEGEVPRDVDARDVAASIQTVWHGLSAQSNLGARRGELMRVVDLVVARLPGGAGVTPS